MIMDGRDLQPLCEKFGYDRVDFRFRENEIAHHHRLVPHRLEGQPAAEREVWLERDAVERDFQVGPRQTDAVDAVRLHRALLVERLGNFAPIAVSAEGSARHDAASDEKGVAGRSKHRRLLLPVNKSFHSPPVRGPPTVGSPCRRYFTMTQSGWMSGKAIKPTRAVVAMSRGLLSFHRNKAASVAIPIKAVSQSPIAIPPSRMQAPRIVPIAAA